MLLPQKDSGKVFDILAFISIHYLPTYRYHKKKSQSYHISNKRQGQQAKYYVPHILCCGSGLSVCTGIVYASRIGKGNGYSFCVLTAYYIGEQEQTIHYAILGKKGWRTIILTYINVWLVHLQLTLLHT